jgi:hypothetical protein
MASVLCGYTSRMLTAARCCAYRQLPVHFAVCRKGGDNQGVFLFFLKKTEKKQIGDHR